MNGIESTVCATKKYVSINEMLKQVPHRLTRENTKLDKNRIGWGQSRVSFEYQVRVGFLVCGRGETLNMSFFIVYITDVPICPLSEALCLLLPSGHHHTVVWVYGLCINVLWLIPSPSFMQSPLPSPHSTLTAICSVCPCLCFYFVHQFILFIGFHI